jgi:hypothetical protein
MPQVFNLQVPAEASYRPIAVEVAERICAIAGGDAAETRAFGVRLAEILAGVRGEGPIVELDFETAGGAIEVRVTCGGQSHVLRHPLSRSVG